MESQGREVQDRLVSLDVLEERGFGKLWEFCIVYFKNSKVVKDIDRECVECRMGGVGFQGCQFVWSGLEDKLEMIQKAWIYIGEIQKFKR